VAAIATFNNDGSSELLQLSRVVESETILEGEFNGKSNEKLVTFHRSPSKYGIELKKTRLVGLVCPSSLSLHDSNRNNKVIRTLLKERCMISPH
jgi:hypothetical protein